MNTKLEQIIQQREEIAIKIKELQKERKRLNNHISVNKFREREKKV